MSSGDFEKNKGAQVQIKFRTPNEKYAVPDTTLSVPSNVDSDGLNKLVKKLLLESSASEQNEVEKVQFDFILTCLPLRNKIIVTNFEIIKKQRLYDTKNIKKD